MENVLGKSWSDMEQFITKPDSNMAYEEENLSLYCHGGFHPVRLGDQFKENRYRVVHKLGFGRFATVWLVRDEQNQKWAALKIMQAKYSTSEGPLSSPHEVSTLEILQDSRYHSPSLYDSFSHEGPNGSHLCIVNEFLGPSLRHVFTDYTNCDDQLPPDDIIFFSRQLLQAVANLHESRIAHGDLNMSNVVFTGRSLASLSEQALFGIIGHPKTASLFLADESLPGPHLPKQLVGTVQWADWIGEYHEDLCLIDFGESFPFGEVPTDRAHPGNLRPPERVLGDKFDYRVDLWQLGCVIYGLVFAAYPFPLIDANDSALLERLIGFVEDLPIENLPPEWEVTWNRLNDGLPPIPPTSEPRLDSRFRDHARKELASLLPVIRGLMRLRPEDRISARDALNLLQDADSSL